MYSGISRGENIYTRQEVSTFYGDLWCGWSIYSLECKNGVLKSATVVERDSFLFQKDGYVFVANQTNM